VLEGLPTEADVLHTFVMGPVNLPMYLAVKALFLLVILSPIGVYIRLNGWAGLHLVKGRAIAISIIVGFNLVLSTLVVVNILSR